MLLTDEQKMIHETVSTLAARELAPRAAEIDRDGRFPREGLQKLAADGLFGMAVPPSMGGTGTDTVSFVVATEAVSKVCASTALCFVTQREMARAVALAGSDEQKGRLLPALISGEKLAAIAVTEASSGSNTAAISTHAKSDGDDFLINGSKIMITGAGEADVYLTVLRTDQSREPMDLTAILVEKDAPGFSHGTHEDFMGMRGASNGELVYDSCRVPKTCLLGAENGWLGIVPKFGGHGMVGIAAISVGIAQVALDAAVQHAKTREIAGKPIGQQQGVQFLIAEAATEIAAARSLLYAACREMDGPPPHSPISGLMSKIHASQMAVDVTRKAMHVHGGRGYSREMPLERYHRDALSMPVHFPTTESAKSMLAGLIMGMPPH